MDDPERATWSFEHENSAGQVQRRAVLGQGGDLVWRRAAASARVPGDRAAQIAHWVAVGPATPGHDLVAGQPKNFIFAVAEKPLRGARPGSNGLMLVRHEYRVGGDDLVEPRLVDDYRVSTAWGIEFR